MGWGNGWRPSGGGSVAEFVAANGLHFPDGTVMTTAASPGGVTDPGDVNVASGNAGGAGDIIFATTTVERMRIMGATGRVGIGTAAPGAQLHVVRGAAGGAILDAPASNAIGTLTLRDSVNHLPSINFDNVNAAGAFQWGIDATGFYGYCLTDTADWIHVLDEADARTGMGNNNPTSKLYVSSKTTGRIALTANVPTGSTVAVQTWAINDSVEASIWNDGSLGIHLSTQPQWPLDVRGTASAFNFQPYSNYSAFQTGVTHPLIYASNGGGAGEFAAAGNMICQARSDVAAFDLYFATGSPPTTQLTIKGSGGVIVGPASGKVGFYGTAPVVKPTQHGVVLGFTAGLSTPVLVDSTFTGNSGATAYTISDLVAALKTVGLITT